MPRYYFHLSDNKQVPDSHKGMSRAGDARRPMELARDLTHGAVMPNRDWTGWFVAIVDAERRKVDEVPIAEA